MGRVPPCVGHKSFPHSFPPTTIIPVVNNPLCCICGAVLVGVFGPCICLFPVEVSSVEICLLLLFFGPALHFVVPIWRVSSPAGCIWNKWLVIGSVCDCACLLLSIDDSSGVHGNRANDDDDDSSNCSARRRSLRCSRTLWWWWW